MSDQSPFKADGAPIPPAILEALERGAKVSEPVTRWRIEPLASTWPVFRVLAGGASYIVKRSDQPARVVTVAALFRSLRLPAIEIIARVDDWLCMTDLGLPTLEDMLARGIAIEQLRQWMVGLGFAAAQADLVAMRDRSLRNIVVAEGGPVFIHIDYEAAFNAGLLDRVARPIRYARYLLRRLFLDVVEASRLTVEGEIDELFKRFRDGIRLGQLAIESAEKEPAPRPALSWRQRLYLRSRLRDTPATQRLFRAAFDEELRRDAQKRRRPIS